MSARIFGGIGGLVPIVAVLIASEGEPLITYIATFGTNYKLIGYLIKVVGLFALGYLWVRLNSETNDLKAFQLGIAAPAIITGLIASYTPKDAPDTKPKEKGDIGIIIGTAYADPLSRPIVVQATFLKDIVGGLLDEPVVADVPIEKLPELFSGPNRRDASDRLIKLYADNKALVVDAVINAIVPESSAAYRINIYVARTLRLIPGKWEGSAAQLQAVELLKQRNSYRNDETFRDNVDGAIANWKLRPAS
ncbi:MAG: hypothetical protein ACK4UO_17540 [Pseudolabrys sp.]